MNLLVAKSEDGVVHVASEDMEQDKDDDDSGDSGGDGSDMESEPDVQVPTDIFLNSEKLSIFADFI